MTYLRTAAPLLLLLFASSTLAQQPALFPMPQHDRWGYVDASGAWAIEPAYAWATPFYEGLAAVTEDARCWGFIEPSGRFASEARFCSDTWASLGIPAVGRYAEGFVTVREGDEAFGQVWGGGGETEPARPEVVYADRSGEIVIRGGFEEAHPFSDGRARVRTDAGYGFIDASGAVVAGPFPAAHDFSEGLAAVQAPGDQGLWGFVDPDGSWAVAPQFRALGALSEGLAAFVPDQEMDEEWARPPTGYVDRNGTVVIEPQFGEGGAFREGVAPVRVEGFWGYADTRGELVIPVRYSEARPFSGGVAAVQDSDGWHFITPAGDLAFDHPSLADVLHLRPFRAGLAQVVFRLPESGGTLSLGSGDFQQVTNAYYGYFRPSGDLVAVQGEDERAAMMAVLEAGWAAEEEEARQQAEAQTRYEEELLADCPEEIVYGDTAHPNVLEYGYAGRVRRLHFGSVSVEELEADRYQVEIPRVLLNAPPAVGWVNAHPASAGMPAYEGWGRPYTSLELQLDARPNVSEAVRASAVRLPRLDCLSQAPGMNVADLLDRWKSTSMVSAEPAGEGTWLTVESRARDSDAWLRLSIATRPGPSPEPAAGAAAYLDDEAVEALALVDPTLRAVYLVPQARQTEGGMTLHEPVVIPLPASGARVGRTTGTGGTRGAETDLYEFVVRQEALIVVDHHRIVAPAAGGGEEGLIRRPKASLSGSLDEVPLGPETLRQRYVASRVVSRPMPTLRVTTGDARAPLVALSPADLPPEGPAPVLRPLVPYEARFATPEALVRLAVRDTTASGRRLLALSFVEEDARQLRREAAEAELMERLGADGFEALMEVLSTVSAMHAAAAASRQWDSWDAEAFAAHATPLYRRLGASAEGLAGTADSEAAMAPLHDLLGEHLVKAYDIYAARALAEMEVHRDAIDALVQLLGELEHHPERIGEARTQLAALDLGVPATEDPEAFFVEAREEMFIRFEPLLMRGIYDEAFRDYAPDVTEVLYDPASGRPVARHGRHLEYAPENLTLDLAVEYRGAASRVEASNEDRGPDAVDLPLPEDVLDAEQVFALIPFLDFERHPEQVLPLFLPDVQQFATYSLEGSSRYAEVELGAAVLALTVAGRETLEVGGRVVPVLRLRAELAGFPPPPLGRQWFERAPTDAGGRRGFEVLVREEAPHHVLLVRVGDHAVRGYPVGDAALPEGDAVRWLFGSD